MSKPELYSRSWCDLIFQDRNHDYGAYRLRRNIGRRYRLALITVGLAAAGGSALLFSLALYLRNTSAQQFQDIATEVRQLKRMEENQNYVTKRISAGQRAPLVATTKDAAKNIPDIAETVTKEDIIFGTNGPETLITEETELAEEQDTAYHERLQDLPTEGTPLIAVDVVREMPQFPGGHRALMSWLDTNILYPQTSINQKIEGDMEVTFYVEATGIVANPQITKPLHPELDSLAVKAFRNMPQWIPGKKGGISTAVCITIPLHFQLR